MRLISSQRYVVALNFILIAGCSYIAARSVNDLLGRQLIVVPPVPHIAPATPLSPSLSRQESDLIGQRDIFNAVKAQPPISLPPEAAVDLHLRLVGTSHLTRTKPLAIIEDDKSHVQVLYQLGDQVPHSGELTAVEKDLVVINHNGHPVTLKIHDELQPSHASMPAPGPIKVAQGFRLDRYIRQVGPNQFLVHRRAVESNLKYLRPLLTQIRARPNLESGNLAGYRLSEVQPDSLFAKLGLRDGDVVSAVNGQDLNNAARTILLLASLRDQNSISVTVMRLGQPVQYSFSIR
jgi:general secretion pathway protein C